MFIPIMLSIIIVSAGLALGTYAIMRVTSPGALNEMVCLIIAITYIGSLLALVTSLITLAVYAVNGLLF